MSGLLLVILVALIFLILYQVGQSSEKIAVLQGEEKFDNNRNNIMGWSMLALFALFMVGIYWCHNYMKPLLADSSIAASDHGENYDNMFEITLWVTGAVFLLTQFLTFWFAFRYRGSATRKPLFYAHSNRLEMIWTTIPALAMAVLVAIGLRAWFKMTSPAPEGAQIIEIVGKQFNWISRYPGPDGKLGERYFKNINEQDNILGLDWKDKDTRDDIVIPNGELRLIKGKPVELIIGARDVIHDVGLSHFRMKMDAVPGITTRMWFTPTITTAEMKEKTGNPDFVYELSCDQMCGVGHYSMKAIVIVETQEEHNAWLKEQQSYYAQNFGEPKEEGETEEAGTEDTKEEDKTALVTEGEPITKK